VAWASGTKDVLFALLSLIALWQYLEFAKEHSRGAYPIATIAFALALLAKPTAIVVPLMAAALDYFVAGRPMKATARSLWLWLLIALPMSFLLDYVDSVPGQPLFYGLDFGLVLLTYVLIQGVAYSYYLKHIVIIDIFTIAAGFVLRAVAGALVLDINITYWLLMCMGLLALFLGLAKRRAELLLLESGAGEHRRILDEYSLPMLDQMISIITAATIIAYTLFTTTAETLPRKPFPIMLVTVPIVIYLIFRYLYLMYKHGEGGSPADLVLKDIPFIVAGALWGGLVLVILALPH